MQRWKRCRYLEGKKEDGRNVRPTTKFCDGGVNNFVSSLVLRGFHSYILHIQFHRVEPHKLTSQLLLWFFVGQLNISIQYYDSLRLEDLRLNHRNICIHKVLNANINHSLWPFSRWLTNGKTTKLEYTTTHSMISNDRRQTSEPSANLLPHALALEAWSLRPNQERARQHGWISEATLSHPQRMDWIDPRTRVRWLHARHTSTTFVTWNLASGSKPERFVVWNRISLLQTTRHVDERWRRVYARWASPPLKTNQRHAPLELYDNSSKKAPFFSVSFLRTEEQTSLKLDLLPNWYKVTNMPRVHIGIFQHR